MTLETSSAASGFEAEVRAIGEELHRSASASRPAIFEPRDWLRRAIERSLDDRELRTALFQFVDVLPSLTSSREIGAHLEEYFGRVDHALGGLTLLSQHLHAGWIVAPIVRRNVAGLARRFIAEEDPDALDKVLAGLRAEPAAFTLDIVGEATVSEVEARRMLARNERQLDAVAARAREWDEMTAIDRGPGGPLPRTNISVKLSALYPRFDPLDPDTARTVRDRLARLLHAARSAGAAITVDMEQNDFRETTLAIFRETLESEEFRDGPAAGIALQAYLRDGADDLEGLLDWARRHDRRIGIRLVKGAYWDTEIAWARSRGWPIPVFLDKGSTDATFEHMTRRLLESTDVVDPQIGSHNVRSLAVAIATARRLAVAPGAWEIQMLHGMAEPLRRAVVARGERVRVYVPVGEILPGMAYLIRRLLENTSNVSFLRQSYVEGADLDTLLAEPAPDDGSADPTPPADAFRNEPVLDVSLARNRAAFRDAIATARTGAFSGRARRAGKADVLVSRNPARPDEIVGEVPLASANDVDAAVADAQAAFAEWSHAPVTGRAEVLSTAAAVMRRRRLELAAGVVLEVGKGWRDADADVTEAIDLLEYYAHETRRHGTPIRTEELPGERNDLVHDPIGVFAVLPPWNFPLAITAGMTGAVLVTGNTAVLKPSEEAPVLGAFVRDVLVEAGVPAGACGLVQGAGEVGACLVGHDDVRGIAFTGSSRVGLGILRDAAARPARGGHLRRVVCEMGGKNAIVVDEDADPDEAVLGILESAFSYQGQKCSAASRLITVGSVGDRLLPRLVEAARTLRTGPPEDPRHDLGPVINERSVERVREAIEAGRRDGRVLLELPAPAGGWFAPLAILADLPADHPVASEEIFGPVLCVLEARDFEEAIALANATPYGLTGGVFSRSPAHLDLARREFRVGNLYLNRKITAAVVRRQPFGGIKLSGSGFKAGGPDYLRQFVESRTISENVLRHGFAPDL